MRVIRNHIENIRSKSPAARTRYSFLAAASVTGLIAIVWVTTLPVRFAGSVSVASDHTDTTQSSADTAAVVQGVDNWQNSAPQTTPEPSSTEGSSSGRTDEAIDQPTQSQAGLIVVPNPGKTKTVRAQ